MAPGSNPQQWVSGCCPAALPQIYATAQMGIAPTLNQQQGPFQPSGGWRMAVPAITMLWILLQPGQHWIAGVVSAK
jgi:hypothetical protein